MRNDDDDDDGDDDDGDNVVNDDSYSMMRCHTVTHGNEDDGANDGD